VRVRTYLIVTAIVALSLNLRPGAVSFGPILHEVRDGLGMSNAVAGVVTTLPVLCFAGFGAIAPRLARALGIHRVITVAIAVSALGLAVRAEARSIGVFILATVAGLSGMAAANVLLPALVRTHFPNHIGLVTGVYTTAIAVGLTGGSVLTVPVADAGGSWRWGLLVWSLCAVLALAPWFGLLREDVRPDDSHPGPISARALAHSRLAWLMAVYFGTQSLQAYCVFGWLPQIYRDAGFSAGEAGLLLGISMAVGIPLSFAISDAAARMRNPRSLVVLLVGCYLVAYPGLIWWPVGGAYVWAFLIGVGAGQFPLVLALIGLRARTHESTAALSGFSQSVGYLIAAVGPVGMGVLHDVTGSWTVPLIVVSIVLVPQLVTGVLVCRPRYVDDEISTS
jgi:CP family cyanate transporter-like MFS transporter